jgi:hypothetical protein
MCEVDRGQPLPEDGREYRQDRAGDDERAADADELDQHRRQDPADSHGSDQQTLQGSEDPGENPVRHRSLEQRRAGDLYEGLTDTE